MLRHPPFRIPDDGGSDASDGNAAVAEERRRVASHTVEVHLEVQVAPL